MPNENPRIFLERLDAALARRQAEDPAGRWNRAKLIRAIGKAAGYFTLMENRARDRGRFVAPKPRDLAALAALLQVSEAWLIGRADEPIPAYVPAPQLDLERRVLALARELGPDRLLEMALRGAVGEIDALRAIRASLAPPAAAPTEEVGAPARRITESKSSVADGTSRRKPSAG